MGGIFSTAVDKGAVQIQILVPTVLHRRADRPAVKAHIGVDKSAVAVIARAEAAGHRIGERREPHASPSARLGEHEQSVARAVIKGERTVVFLGGLAVLRAQNDGQLAAAEDGGIEGQEIVFPVEHQLPVLVSGAGGFGGRGGRDAVHTIGPCDHATVLVKFHALPGLVPHQHIGGVKGHNFHPCADRLPIGCPGNREHGGRTLVTGSGNRRPRDVTCHMVAAVGKPHQCRGQCGNASLLGEQEHVLVFHNLPQSFVRDAEEIEQHRLPLAQPLKGNAQGLHARGHGGDGQRDGGHGRAERREIGGCQHGLGVGGRRDAHPPVGVGGGEAENQLPRRHAAKIQPVEGQSGVPRHRQAVVAHDKTGVGERGVKPVEGQRGDFLGNRCVAGAVLAANVGGTVARVVGLEGVVAAHLGADPPEGVLVHPRAEPIPAEAVGQNIGECAQVGSDIRHKRAVGHATVKGGKRGFHTVRHARFGVPTNGCAIFARIGAAVHEGVEGHDGVLAVNGTDLIVPALELFDRMPAFEDDVRQAPCVFDKGVEFHTVVPERGELVEVDHALVLDQRQHLGEGGDVLGLAVGAVVDVPLQPRVLPQVVALHLDIQHLGHLFGAHVGGAPVDAFVVAEDINPVLGALDVNLQNVHPCFNAGAYRRQRVLGVGAVQADNGAVGAGHGAAVRVAERRQNLLNVPQGVCLGLGEGVGLGQGFGVGRGLGLCDRIGRGACVGIRLGLGRRVGGGRFLLCAGAEGEQQKAETNQNHGAPPDTASAAVHTDCMEHENTSE